jgi:hypothetical protein
MSKYDDIETAAELIREVAAHGISMDIDDKNRAADIFGNSAIAELAALANDIGRNKADGEPDPNGTWSSSRRATQGTFYLIAFSIWNWKQAVDFYNEYTDPTRAEARRLRKENANLESAIKEVTRERDAAADTLNNVNSQFQQSTAACEKLTERVIALKARLYDLMTAGD